MEVASRHQVKRKHTKRTTGCDTCRERKVRCDETRPRCENCVKYGRNHEIRCNYPVDDHIPRVPPGRQRKTIPQDSPLSITTPLLSQDQSCLRSGSRVHYLIHHVLNLSQDARHSQIIDNNLGTKLYVKAVEHAKEVPFLQDCVCGVAVQHLYGLTKSVDLLCERYFYRGEALKGLREYLSSGNKLNHGAILVACLMLSWDAQNSDEFWRTMQGISLVLNRSDTNDSQSDITEMFLPVAETRQIARWCQDRSYLLENALHSLDSLIKLVKEEPVLTRAARELRNFFVNMTNLQFVGLTEPSQLKAIFAARSWLPWVPTILEEICRSSEYMTPFLMNFEMVKMAQILILPEIRYSMALHERARNIRSTYARLSSDPTACDELRLSALRGPMLIADAYLISVGSHIDTH